MPYSSVDDISSLNPSSGSSSSDESPSELSHPDDHSPMNPNRGAGIVGANSKETSSSGHQKSLPVAPNLSALKEICATAASSDGLYDSGSVANVSSKQQQPRTVPVHNATNYLGDSCTSFEFLGKSDQQGHHNQQPSSEDRLLLLPSSSSTTNNTSAVETQRSSSSNKGGGGGSGHSHTSSQGSNAGHRKNSKRKTPPSSVMVSHTNSGTTEGQNGTGRSGGSNNNGAGGGNNGDDGSSTHSTGARKDSSCQTEKSYVKGNQNRISDFEKEIKKLLERQHLPQVDELASVQKVLSAMGKLG